MILLSNFLAGVCNGAGNKVESMVRPRQTSLTTATVGVTLLVAVIGAAKFGRVRPSDWDERKTPFVRACSKATYERRFQTKRRGQDSNLRTSFPVTGLANRRFRPLSHLSKRLWLRIPHRRAPASPWDPDRVDGEQENWPYLECRQPVNGWACTQATQPRPAYGVRRGRTLQR